MLRGRFARHALCVACAAAAVQGCGSDSRPPPSSGPGSGGEAGGVAGGAASGTAGGDKPDGSAGANGGTPSNDSGGAAGSSGESGDGAAGETAGGAPSEGASGAGGVDDGEPPSQAGAGGESDGNAGTTSDAGRGGESPDPGTSGAGGAADSGESGAGGATNIDTGGASGAGGAPSVDGGRSGAGGANAAGAGGDEDAGGESGAGGEPNLWIEPVLSDLVITGAQVPLKPSFSPERARYAFIPRSSGASPAVSATAADGLTLEIAGVVVSSGTSVSLSALAPGSAFDVVVSNRAGASRTYNVQYLPAGFPDLRVTIAEPGASSDPIYANLKRGVGGGAASYVTKFDNAGVPLHYRTESIDTYDFKKHAGGFMSYARGREDTEQVVLDADFNDVRRVKTAGLVNTDVHDFHVLPSGHQILMAYEPAERDLTPYGGSGLLVVQDAVLQELDVHGQVVFQWQSWGVLPYDQSLYPNATDYAHVNSIELANDGNWLVSVRGFSQVVKLDRSSGAILWRLGGIANEFTFLDDPLGSFCGQHTVSQLADGHLLIFDNGNYCWPESSDPRVSRVVEYEIDEVAKTARLVWSYTRSGTTSAAQGSAQRLPNGNTFIGWGSNSNVLATEVDPTGHPVFEVQATSNRGGFVSYRARRFAD